MKGALTYRDLDERKSKAQAFDQVLEYIRSHPYSASLETVLWMMESSQAKPAPKEDQP